MVKILPEYKRRVKYLREKQKLSYTEIGKILGVSRFTASRIYRKTNYVSKTETQELIKKRYYKFYKKKETILTREFRSEMKSKNLPKGFIAKRNVTSPYGVIRKRLYINQDFTAETNKQIYYLIEKRLKEIEKEIPKSIKVNGGHAIGLASFFQYDGKEYQIEGTYNVATYYYENSERGMNIAIEILLYEYIQAKLFADEYGLITLHHVDLIYRVEK